MKVKLLLISLLLSSSMLLFSQTYVWQDFAAGQMPPAGWSIDGYQAQWSVSASANAGGTAPEAMFTYIQATELQG